MSNYTELLKLIKQASSEAIEAGKPINVCYGKVISTAPLKIVVDQKMTLSTTQLELTRNVMDYETNISVEWVTEATTAGDAEHKHNIKGKKKIIVHNALKTGDRVILLRQQGGQKYIVMDKVG